MDLNGALRLPSLSFLLHFLDYSHSLSLLFSLSLSLFSSIYLPLSFFFEDRVFAFIPADHVPAAVSSLLLLPSGFFISSL